jgi:putative nucleotidyltransferase with HDIG domain
MARPRESLEGTGMKELKDWLYLFEDDAVLTVVAAMGRLFAKDNGHTYRHSMAVASYAGLCAEAMALPGPVIEEAIVVGLLHDIGKINVERHLLVKPGRLTVPERHEMRRHIVVGEELLRTIPRFMAVSRAVRAHHECWDGRGYPDHLRGTQIPITARLVIVADSFDAMTRENPCRASVSVETALAQLALQRGQMFDPDITDCFIDRIRQTPIPLLGHPAKSQKPVQPIKPTLLH